MWQGVVVVCAPIQPCAVQFSCLSISLFLPFAAATSSNGRWEREGGGGVVRRPRRGLSARDV